MEISKIKTVYFEGIGGIGMSALARYFKYLGKNVMGYDKTPTQLSAQLQKEGIEIHYHDDVNFCLQACENETLDATELLVIYTPAIPAEQAELNWWKNSKYQIYKRAQVLGIIAKGAYTIAVAGTHGKTSTSSIIAQLLHSAGLPVNAFIGGIAKNFDSNFVLNNNLWNEQRLVVVEADEYDRSFLQLFPDIAVLSSLDADHLDIYQSHQNMVQSYQDFCNQIKENGRLIIKSELPLKSKQKTITYSAKDTADYSAKNIRIINHQYVFDVQTPEGILKDLSLGLPGRHNVENAVAAVAVGQLLGLSYPQIKTGLASYLGVKRRFDYHHKNGVVYIDDYAHHPRELEACILSVKELYPDKKITGIFQPHLYSRTRDFALGFAKSLSLLDELILLEIYPAREKPMEGVSSKLIFDLVEGPKKRMSSLHTIMDDLKELDLQVLISMGAGDIDTIVQPIATWLSSK